MTATKAADSNYNATTSAAITVTLNKGTQGAVAVTAPASASFGQTGLSAVASGGSGTGAFSYDAGSSTACSVNAASGALSIISASGSCSITATRAADTNYLVSAASAAATVSVGMANQATLTAIATPSTVAFGSTSALTTSGGNGSGTVSFSAGASTGCSVTGSTLSVTNAGGNCSVTATKAADSNYNATTSAAVVVTLAVSPVNGACGSANGSSFAATPAVNLCSFGSASGVTGSGPWLWSCNGTNGGSTANCTASIYNATLPVAITGSPSGNFTGTKTGTSFTILRSEGGNPFSPVLTSATSTSFTDTSALQPNTIYQYAVTSDTDPTQTVFLTIRTPLFNGWNIVAVPYNTTGLAASAFFASPVSSIYQWIPTGATAESSSSQLGSYTTVSTLTPGLGYFAKTSNGSTILAYSGASGPSSTTVTLKPGWTMIANPTVSNKTNIGTNWLMDGIPLYAAVDGNKIGGSVYWWNGTTYDSWTIIGDNPQIEPWKGYWIINLDSVSHVLTIQ